MLNFPATNATAPSLEAPQLEDLLNYLRQAHQVDLTSYKRSSLMRRTLVRMQQVGVAHYQDYLNYLQQQSDEVMHLLDTIYINFTDFFRDPYIWQYLAKQIIPQVLASKAAHEPIRVWSAGCASGEETYSLAILLIEILGLEQFQQRVWIYGTDVDAQAIRQARKGRYSAYKVDVLPAPLREQYFERRNDNYYWRRDLYGSIRFHQHDLVQNSPLTQIDLLVCRNLLIYLTEQAQLQVLASFHASLNDTGFLWLGHVEALASRFQRSLFVPVHWQSRVFAKVADASSSHSLSDFSRTLIYPSPIPTA